MPCPYDTTIECTGPLDGDRWWNCPQTGARLTRSWAKLCYQSPKYHDDWAGGHGPGQKPRPKDPPKPPASKATNTPARVRARKLVCKECPDNNWVEAAGTCQAFSPERRCLMRSYFNSLRRVCKHWPE